MAKTEVFHVHLTDQRQQLLSYIQEFHNQEGYAPTVRELAAWMGSASPGTIHAHLAILRQQKAVDWVDGQARTLHLTPSGHAALRA